MRVFVAGATGAIGRPLVALLLDGRPRRRRAGALRGAGRRPARAGRRRRDRRRARPRRDAPGGRRGAARGRGQPAHRAAGPHRPAPLRARLGPTSHLREVTGPLFARAAREAGARRLIAQSVSFISAPQGPPVLDETAPLRPRPARGDGPRWPRAIVALERAVTGRRGDRGRRAALRLLLRPGNGLRGRRARSSRTSARRRLPIVGAGRASSRSSRVDDAAAATVLALDRGGARDLQRHRRRADRPARVGARPGRRARCPAPRAGSRCGSRACSSGPVATAAVTARGASNAKARRELGWAPRWPSVREGFPALVAGGARGPRDRPRGCSGRRDERRSGRVSGRPLPRGTRHPHRAAAGGRLRPRGRARERPALVRQGPVGRAGARRRSRTRGAVPRRAPAGPAAPRAPDGPPLRGLGPAAPHRLARGRRDRRDRRRVPADPGRRRDAVRAARRGPPGRARAPAPGAPGRPRPRPRPPAAGAPARARGRGRPRAARRGPGAG